MSPSEYPYWPLFLFAVTAHFPAVTPLPVSPTTPLSVDDRVGSDSLGEGCATVIGDHLPPHLAVTNFGWLFVREHEYHLHACAPLSLMPLSVWDSDSDSDLEPLSLSTTSSHLSLRICILIAQGSSETSLIACEI
ncbi:hypothetical protein BDP55DRAFT_364078 [Colletotrichum godetiae]|uniref:Secreted protein n=1 Tax=Colletotrichum godetiae TaxID=1209918 RepID=A0AAJ0ACR6_9PEZI|nr:uncharacterized protein BDP55DRAFT_364078 [Colletotrichum godetiae]KAK1659231.1 hypothetical protein BDP55DRAFT_364078 [Colletotrichum godetiae]